ncbi:hypothetical protein [Cellulomonas endophytica]|uniref:hypothetical protein n=1 Tax=Cellulomonas endophytica TaxID=2494735 RepID=UPI0013E98CED|nr:hypothetical protein [Cellulomonas endophytica]
MSTGRPGGRRKASFPADGGATEQPRYRDTTNAYIDDERVVLFGPVTSRSVAAAARRLAEKPLRRFHTHQTELRDIDFLVDLPPLHGASITIDRLQDGKAAIGDVGRLAHHADTLTSLKISPGRRTEHLEVLSELPHLRELYVEGDGLLTGRILGRVLQGAPATEHLALERISKVELDLLSSAGRLRALALKLGSVVALDAISDLAALRFVEVWQTRGVTGLQPIVTLPELEVLHLEALPRASAEDWSTAASLRHANLFNISLPEGPGTVAQAPELRQVRLGGLQTRESVAPFRHHPHLHGLRVLLRGEGLVQPWGLDHLPDAPFVAHAAGNMGLPPYGWFGDYLQRPS